LIHFIKYTLFSESSNIAWLFYRTPAESQTTKQYCLIHKKAGRSTARKQMARGVKKFSNKKTIK
jgi:hypothetical protein